MQLKILTADKELFGSSGAYPFWRDTRIIPVKLVKAYPDFIVFNVLPHKCKNSMAFGMSKPYTISIDRSMINSGVVEIC